jgi:hypothetical protein
MLTNYYWKFILFLLINLGDYTMSSMLEQAIVDATALKEAAMKNAESAIIEKYSQEIKETVDTMLSEVEADYAPLDEPQFDQDPAAEETTGSGVVSLDLTELTKMARESLGEEVDFAEMLTHEDLAEDIEADATSSETTGEVGNIDEEIDLQNLFESEENEANEKVEEDIEEIEISEEQLKDIVEKLTLDFHPEKTGWLEKPQYETRQAELEAEALAVHDDSDDEKMDKLEEALKLSNQENENLRGKLEKMTGNIQEMKSFANRVKGTLSEVNLQNARLLYINKALSSDSLNGRQKEKLVEAISNSKTVEEAKVIYETLQGAVGEQRSHSNAPKSLTEAVTKRSSALLKGSEAKPEADPNMDRMKRLAGIN